MLRVHYTRPMQLTERQKKTLRRLGHALNPVVALGNHGLTDAVVAEMDRALTDHELIKVRVFADAHADRNAVLHEICENLSAAPVQHIGKILVIYRPKPDAPEGTKKTARKRKPQRRTKRSYQG